MPVRLQNWTPSIWENLRIIVEWIHSGSQLVLDQLRLGWEKEDTELAGIKGERNYDTWNIFGWYAFKYPELFITKLEVSDMKVKWTISCIYHWIYCISENPFNPITLNILTPSMILESLLEIQVLTCFYLWPL